MNLGRPGATSVLLALAGATSVLLALAGASSVSCTAEGAEVGDLTPKNLGGVPWMGQGFFPNS
jgi:hypothetical protein